MKNDEVLQAIALHIDAPTIYLPRKMFAGELERYISLGVFNKTNDFLLEINCPGGCGEMAAVTKTISGKYITTCGHTDRPMEDFEIAPEEVELYRLDRVTFEKLCNDGTIDFDSTLARAQRDNNIYNNSPSPKGTGIDNNSNNNSKKNVPKKGGGRWQSGDGKKMIDEFLDWVDKDSISSDLKALARKVWDNKAHKDFVAKQIDPRKGYAASNDAFENKFYPACMRAIREREKQRCNAAKAREQSRDALANEELQNCKLHGEYAILTAK